MPRKTAFEFRYLEVDEADLRRELYVTTAGCMEHPAGRPYPSPGHPDGYRFDWRRGRVLNDFALIFLSRGAGIFETRTRRRTCRAGDVLLIPPGAWHRYRPDAATGWCEHWVCANGEFLHRLRSRGHFIKDPVLLPGAATARLRHAHRRLWAEVRRLAPANSLLLSAVALEVFAEALPALRVSDRTSVRVTAPGDALAHAARDLIRLNSHRPITAGLAARQLGVSRRTLERHYLREFGLTVLAELMACRVRRARQLLTTTTMAVKEISYTVGFGDSRRLIRNFSRVSGQTPAAFRRGSLKS